MRPVRSGAVVLLLLSSVAASLPEETGAPGARPGAPEPPTRVVSLGDSVPTGARRDCSPFPVLVAADLAAPGQRVGLEQLAEDGDHPDAQGQRAIADAVLRALPSEHAARSPGIP